MSGNVPHSGETNIRTIVRAVRQLFEGRSNAVGTVTLDASADTTTVPFVNAGSASTIVLFPTTANAAAEVAAGGLFVSAKASGSFTVSHANNAQTDRTFDFHCLG